VALFTKLIAVFWIVEPEDDSECDASQQKCFDCRHKPLEHYLALKTQPFMDSARGRQVAQGEYSLGVDQIDWGQYDIVIHLDISVPREVYK